MLHLEGGGRLNISIDELMHLHANDEPLVLVSFLIGKLSFKLIVVGNQARNLAVDLVFTLPSLFNLLKLSYNLFGRVGEIVCCCCWRCC